MSRIVSLLLGGCALLACKGPTEAPAVPAKAPEAAVAPAPAKAMPPPAPKAPIAAVPVAPPAGPAAPPPSALIGQQIPAFMAEVDTYVGEKLTPSKFDSRKAGAIVVYTVLGTGCPASRAYVERTVALDRDYGSKGVKFVYLYPNVDEQPDQKRAFHKQNGYPGGLVDDKGATIVKLLGAQRSSEMIIADKSAKIVFRGPLDDSRNPLQVKQRYVGPALDELLVGKSVTVPYANVFA